MNLPMPSCWARWPWRFRWTALDVDLLLMPMVGSNAGNNGFSGARWGRA